MAASQTSAQDDPSDDWRSSPASQSARPIDQPESIEIVEESVEARPIDQMESAGMWEEPTEARPINQMEPSTNWEGKPRSPKPKTPRRLVGFITKSVFSVLALTVVVIGVKLSGLWEPGAVVKPVTNNDGKASEKPPSTPDLKSTTVGIDPSPNSGKLPTVELAVDIPELVGIKEKASPAEQVEMVRKYVEQLRSEPQKPDPARVRQCLHIVNEVLKTTADEAEKEKLDYWHKSLEEILEVLSFSAALRRNEPLEGGKLSTTLEDKQAVHRQATLIVDRLSLIAVALLGAIDDAPPMSFEWPLPPSFDTSWLAGHEKEWNRLKSDWLVETNPISRSKRLIRASEIARDLKQWDTCQFYHREAESLLPVSPKGWWAVDELNRIRPRLRRLKDEITDSQLQALRMSLATAEESIGKAKSRVDELEKGQLTAQQAIQEVARRGCEDLLKGHRLAERWKFLNPQDEMPPEIDPEKRKKVWKEGDEKLAAIQKNLTDSEGAYDSVTDDYAALDQLLSLASTWETERVVATRVASAKVSLAEFQQMFSAELDQQFKKDGKLSLWKTLQNLTWPTKDGKIVLEEDVRDVAKNVVTKKLEALFAGKDPADPQIVAALLEKVVELEKGRITVQQVIDVIALHGCEELLKRQLLAEQWASMKPQDGVLPPGVDLQKRTINWEEGQEKLAGIEKRLANYKDTGVYEGVDNDYSTLLLLRSLASEWKIERNVVVQIAAVELTPKKFQTSFEAELDRELEKDGKLSLWKTLEKLKWPAKDGKIVLESDVEAVAQKLRSEIKERRLADDQVVFISGQVGDVVRKLLFSWGYVPPEAPPVDLPQTGPVVPNPYKAIECFDLGYHAYFRSSEESSREAVRQLSLACQFAPDNALYRYFLGLAHYRVGDIEAAAVQARNGAKLELTHPYYGLPQRLERVQTQSRLWLERVRHSVHSAPIRSDS
ncbi:MAG: hypothetical protein NTZ32_01075 [Planctomycetales bacterium]|nr:hypothetical protein [Planctomycetales bacterium]